MLGYAGRGAERIEGRESPSPHRRRQGAHRGSHPRRFNDYEDDGIRDRSAARVAISINLLITIKADRHTGDYPMFSRYTILLECPKQFLCVSLSREHLSRLPTIIDCNLFER